MSGFSAALAAEIINLTLRGISMTPAAAHWLALFTADPTDAGLSTNELADSNYSRVNITGKIGVPDPDDKFALNTAAIIFQPLAAGVTVTHAGIYYVSSGGVMKYSAAFAAPYILAVDEAVVIDVGDLKIQL